MDFSVNTNSSQAPDDVFLPLNNLISSGTANTDENADFSGPVLFVPSFLTRPANSQPSLMNGDIIGGESQVWNPYLMLPPLPICRSNERSVEILQNHFAVCQNQQINHSPVAVAPPNSTAPTIEDENQGQPLTLAAWLASGGVGPSSFASSYPSGVAFHQNNIGHSWSFDGSSMLTAELKNPYLSELLTKMIENPRSYKNMIFGYGEVNGREDNQRRKKGCKCTKSKCLRLYCECFSSELHCDESCACKACNNKSECGSIVLSSRANIKIRNSYAFSPKIVPILKEHPLLPRIWPSSASMRHRRGCSCKKSKCIKKYCECYQANVKCSAVCRCKDCENVCRQEDDFMIGETMNNSGYSYGEMLPQAESNNYNNFGPQTMMSLGNNELLGLSCPSLESDPSIPMSFGNSMDDSPSFLGRMAEDGNLAPLAPQLTPYSRGMGSSISSAIPNRQWLPGECSSFGNSCITDPTFGPPPPPLMNCYDVSADHNGTPLMLNDSRLPAPVGPFKFS